MKLATGGRVRSRRDLVSGTQSLIQEVRLVPHSSLALWPHARLPGRSLRPRESSAYSHVDPLLQRVGEVLLADGMCEGPQSRPELDNGCWQVLEPAAELHLLLENTDALF